MGKKNKNLSQIVPFWVRFCPILFDQELGQENFASFKLIAFVQGGADQVPQDPKQKHQLSPVMFPPQRKNTSSLVGHEIFSVEMKGRVFRKSTLGEYGNTLLGYNSFHLLRYSCIHVLRIVFFRTPLGVLK